jgi:hypothetical protein|tara:strand:+ start:605 stop:1300 length:696 start_codon:yes stop_codon:yes gene_type:complete
MGAYKKLKWQKTLNEYKFLVEELSLVKSIGRATAVDFQQHYEDFLKSNDINLSELNEQHRDRIKEAYNVEEEDVCGDLPVIEASNTSLVVDKAEQPRDSEIQMTADEVAVHNMFSKLFKSIAVKIHPDKIDPLKHDYLQRRKMEKDFVRANSALKDREYFVLIEIAEELKIPLPKNYDQQTRWMKVQIAGISMEIDQQKKTYNYIFSEAETDDEKDSVIRQFVRQLFNISL